MLAGLSFSPAAPYGDVACSQLWTPLSGPVTQPGFLTAAQLASLQQTVLLSLPWIATVERKTANRDAASGEWVETWAPIGSTNCDVEFMDDAEETPIAGKVTAIGSYLITLPYNADIQPEDRLTVNSVTYEVRNRFTNWTDQAAVYASAEEVR